VRSIVAIALAFAVFAPGVSAQKAPAKGRTRQIFVSVADKGGQPVLDLQASDFDVNEGGAKRAVVRAGLASSPMRVAVLVDTSDTAAAAVNQIRAGLGQFLDALPPEHEVLLASLGRQLRVRVQPTLDRKKLKDTAAGLFADGGGIALMDGLLEIDDRFMKKAEDRWPVFVVLTTDGSESSAGAHENEFNRWLASLRPRGVSAHALLLKYKGNGLSEIIANGIADNADGRYEVVNTPNSIPDKMRAMALDLAADFNTARMRYRVEFTSDAPDTAPVDVGVLRDGVTLRLMHTRLR
jgi:hypothetical protein